MRLALFFLLAMFAAGSFVQAAETPTRPNIIIVMADDMGFSDIGCYGSEIQTPNLDRLAGKGVRFAQFYNNARCCPTRASLLTGLYSHQAGIGHMVENRGTPAYQGFLNDKCVTIAEALGATGYKTYMSGKWHVGEQRPHWPVDRGFQKSYSLISGASNYFKLPAGRTLVRDDERITPDDDWYITDAISDNAVDMLKAHDATQPFFMYVAYTAPHWPLHAKAEDIARYRGKYRAGWDKLRAQRHAKMMELGIVDKAWALTERDPKVPAWEDVPEERRDEWDLRMAVYAAQIDCMDQGIGKVLAQLEAMKQTDNTLVLFLADNGGCAEIIDQGTPGKRAGDKDSFLSYGVGWANASNTPFRLYKHWVHEGGISSPLIASWPAVIKEPAITAQPGHLVDLMATCVDISQTKYPATFKDRPITPLAGKSLAPIFRGAKTIDRGYIFWEHEGNKAVRDGNWKIVARHNQPWELYDIAADRTELHDLASQHPDRVARLTAAWEKWATDVGVDRNWGKTAEGGKKKKKKQ